MAYTDDPMGQKPRYRPIVQGAPAALPSGAFEPPAPVGTGDPLHKPAGVGAPVRKMAPSATLPRTGAAPRPPAPVAPPPVVPPPPAPPVPPPVAPPALPGEALGEQTFLPGEDTRLTGAQGATDKAMTRIAAAKPYSAQAATNEGRYRGVFGDAKDSGKYMAEQDAALAGLGGPSRTELAKQALADFDKAGEAGLAARFRKVGQTSAKFGRLGMGDVNAELGSIQGDYERDRMAKANELAAGVAEGDISDRFRRVDATSGLRRGEAGLASGIRGENFDRARSAIDYGGRDASQDIGNEYDQLNAAGNLEDRIFGQGQSNRGEFRAERGYQDSRRRESLDNRIRQRELENAEQQQRINRALALYQSGGRAPNLEDLLRAG